MAKVNLPNIKLNLLRPQGAGEKLHVRFGKWLLSTGRFLIVFVEALVLAAFIGRFKLDADQAALKDSIDQQIPFVESLAADERLIRQTQLQLATIKQVRSNSPDYGIILKNLANQSPQGVRIISLSLESGPNQVNIKLTGSALTDQDLNTFATGLEGSKFFSNVTLSNISLDQGVIPFSLETSVLNSLAQKTP